MARGQNSYRSASAMGYRSSGNDTYGSSRQGNSSARSTGGAQSYLSSRSGAAEGYSSSRCAGAGGAGDSDSSADEGYGGGSVSTARQGQTGGGGGGSDGVDQAAASSMDAVNALASAAESAENSSKKASNLATSHGGSLADIASAIRAGGATEEDAAALEKLAETLGRFSASTARMTSKVTAASEAQRQAHQQIVAAAGGADPNNEEVKAYSLGRTGAGRHSGRYRSGVFDSDGYATSGGVGRSSSRAARY